MDRPKILIVEDDSDLSELLSVYLGAAGFDTTQANTSRQGITKALAERPDLIITDLHLQDVNALEAMEILKKDPATSGIPIVALSATSLGDWRNKNPKD
jgi:CheY-like chemotaxis protein